MFGRATPPPGLMELEPFSLLIDFDGTLVELIDDPGRVRVDGALHDLLTGLALAVPGRVALISGRSIVQLERFLGPLAGRLVLAGSHGGELRWPQGRSVAPERPAGLDAAEAALAEFAAANAGVLVEAKDYSAALHYRAAPEAMAAAQALCRDLASRHGLTAQPGKMMVELKAAGDKGDAVRAFMAEPPMAGTRPIFVGDDLTDEAGFMAARALGGAGVLVGPGWQTAAVFGLADVAAVRAWLATAIP
jgi:trehalose 6-phosphate phosphatase